MGERLNLPDRLATIVHHMQVRNLRATMKHIDADWSRVGAPGLPPDTDRGLDRTCRKIIEGGLCWRDIHATPPPFSNFTQSLERDHGHGQG